MSSVLEDTLEEVALKKLANLENLPIKDQEAEVESIRKLVNLKVEQQKADVEYDDKEVRLEHDQKRLELEEEEHDLRMNQAEDEKKKSKFNIFLRVLEAVVIPVGSALLSAGLFVGTRNRYMVAEYGKDPYGAMTSRGGQKILNKGMDLLEVKKI